MGREHLERVSDLLKQSEEYLVQIFPNELTAENVLRFADLCLRDEIIEELVEVKVRLEEKGILRP